MILNIQPIDYEAFLVIARLPWICPPVIGVVASNAKRLKQGFELLEYLT